MIEDTQNKVEII